VQVKNRKRRTNQILNISLYTIEFRKKAHELELEKMEAIKESPKTISEKDSFLAYPGNNESRWDQLKSLRCWWWWHKLFG
jgi:hypothetical protein